MRSKRFLHSRWQYCSPILVALSLVDQGAIRVLRTEAQTLPQALAGTISEVGYDPLNAPQRASPRCDL